jgi:glutamate carboxypeptidase
MIRNRELYLKQLIEYFQTQQQSFKNLLKELVSFPTFSHETKTINQLLDYLEELFSPFNPKVSRTPTHLGDILVLSINPEKEKFLVLLSHVDIVKVSDSPLPIYIRENKFFANGCYDMKSAILLFYFALKAIKEFQIEISSQLKLIFTPDEEIGSKASKPLLLKECQGARAVILPEPSCPDGGVKTRRKGTAYIKAEFKGKAAHSGIEPEKGSDANRALSTFIKHIDYFLHQSYPEVSFNPGLISGGYRRNIVSPFSVLEGDLRSFSNQELLKAMEEINKIDRVGNIPVVLQTELMHPALEFNQKNKFLYELAKEIAECLGYKLSPGSSGGGSDGATLSSAGVPVIDGLGLKGGGAHSSEEHINLSDFPFRASLVTALCKEL